jgi:hypothetical protein
MNYLTRKRKTSKEIDKTNRQWGQKKPPSKSTEYKKTKVKYSPDFIWKDSPAVTWGVRLI